MKKAELADCIARKHRVSQSAAADLVDRVVTDLVKALKHGKPAAIPGLGTLALGTQKSGRKSPGKRG
jgi:nucleoid DNA-binding protein